MFNFTPKPNFNNLIDSLNNCNKSGYTPAIELGIHPIIKEQVLGRKVSSLGDDIEFMRKSGYDYVKIQPKVNFFEEEYRKNNSMPQDRVWAVGHAGKVTNWEEFEKFRWTKQEEIDYSTFDLAEKILPTDMCVIGQYGDILTMAWEIMGFENFSFALYEDPDLVNAIIDKLAEPVLSMYKTMSEYSKVKALWYSDDIAYGTGLMISPDTLDEIFFPNLSKIGEFAQIADKPLIYHSDGLLYDVKDSLVECNVSAIHPLEPNAMNIEEARSIFDESISFCGGIELDTLSRGTPSEVSTLAKDIIKKAGNIGYCAGSSNSITDYVPIENFVALVNAIHSTRLT